MEDSADEGPVTHGVIATPPFGSMAALDHVTLMREHALTLASPRRS